MVDFHPSHGTLDQFFTLSRILEGAFKFAQPVYMYFVDCIQPFPSEYSVGGASGVWSVWPVVMRHLILVQRLQELGPHSCQ